MSFISLFSGAGGLDLGFIEAGHSPLWANDIDQDAVNTYNASIPAFAERMGVALDGHRAMCGNIRSMPLPNHLEPDILIGGPPCQGFSVAGKMDPNDPRSRHVWDFIEAVALTEPQAFVMENVKALAINRRFEAIRRGLIDAANRLGYRTELFLLDASHYGVPQLRERMFLVGIRDGQPVAPRPFTEKNPPSVRSVLANLPQFGTPGNDSICSARITAAKNPVLRKSPYAGMLFNGQGRALNLERPSATLPASMGGNRTPIIDQEALENKTVTNWVESYHHNLITGGNIAREVPQRMRRLTVEEAAAIQTFPTEMRFQGSQCSKFKQIGNAVPRMLALAVAQSVNEALGINQMPLVVNA
jgi:DNA (cytosine-5)-methyltransferase 1